jgi:isoleucyl-tRNA synthetase
MKDTLQLPRTDFPMRAQLATREPERLLQWQQMGLWQAIRAAGQGRPPFVLHDGPPYANGGLHQGHLLNKILKDVIVKDRAMAGFAVSFRPGWDCHGLPIETQVDKAAGGRKAGRSVQQTHADCRAWAQKFIDVQREGFERLGVLGDWQAPYVTMDPAYQADILRTFADLFDTGKVFRGLRPVHWCTRHQTALAEAEVEYESKRSHSLLLRMEVVAEQAEPPAALGGRLADLDLVVWTTTPWSLPGNVAVVVHPDVSYVVAPVGGRHVLVAEALYGSFVASLAAGVAHEQAPSPSWPRVLGRALTGLRYRHPFLPREGAVLADPFVSVETGTGLVHCAPAHGHDDFVVCRRAGLAVVSPVDAKGCLNQEAGPFAGLDLAAGSDAIVAFLAERSALLSPATARIEHRYAHCWRCHQPVITRATEQWFLSMDQAEADAPSLRTLALEALEHVAWIPRYGVERIRSMLASRPDWCLSRQRTWGVALPIAYCERCEAPWADAQAMRHAADVVAQHDAAALWGLPVAQIFGQAPACGACGGRDFRMGRDILDVWFDSGVSWRAALPARDGAPPADLYLEGSDQHRGWFHSSLLTHAALEGGAPYRRCLTHGFVVDGHGKKISKSRGNFVDPFASIAKEGAEIWRLWAASEDFQGDVRLSPQILKQASDHYRKLRNTLRYLLGSLADFAPQSDRLPVADLLAVDAWALGEAQHVATAVRGHFEACQFHLGLQRLSDFCNSFLSALYLDMLKDRLYAERADGRARRSGQTAIYQVAIDVIRLLAPVLAFTADEAWSHLPGREGRAASVHLALYPGVGEDADEAARRAAICARHELLSPRFAAMRAVRRVANAALEAARRDKVIGSSTEAQCRLALPEAEPFAPLSQVGQAEWCEWLIVSDVSVCWVAADAPHVEVAAASGQKCERCWQVKGDAAAQGGRAALCARCRKVLAPCSA